MKLVADPIYVDDNADWQTIEDAKARANWHSVLSREERMKNTCLDGKCGSCEKFCPKNIAGSKVTGKCKDKGDFDFRQRSTPGCKFYKRRTDEQRSD